MRRYLKKTVSILILIILVSLLSQPVQGQELETVAVSAVLIDGATGQILFEKNANESRAPASMTKIMTLLLAIEAIEAGRVGLQDEVLVADSVTKLGPDPGTHVWLLPGEKWSLQKLLISIAVASANDSCIVVAEHIAGTESLFVKMMNDRAQELGMLNTNFINSHGLSAEGHFMSAYDTALLSREAAKHAKLLELTSIYEYPRFRPDPRPLDLWNTNKLLAWYDGVDGLKTGWTEDAGYCLAATSQKDGLRLISVVMGCPLANSHFSESIKILQYGFANYKTKKIISKGETVKNIRVKRGKEQEVELIAESDLYLTHPKGEEEFEMKVQIDHEYLNAPINASVRCGEVQVWRGGKVVGHADLITARSIEKGNPISLSWDILLNWFRFMKN